MSIATIGIDLAKNVFQVHGVDEHGQAVLRRSMRRADLRRFFASLPSCLIGMEACGGAHYWARELIAMGHAVKLMAPQFVKPYVKANKNDARDAEAICEAVSRPSMRFVPVKSVEQQGLLSLHRARQGFVAARTAQVNQMRGQLNEKLPQILEDADSGLPGLIRDLMARLLAHFRELDRQVKELEAQIGTWHRQDAASRNLQKVPGIGPLTASALVASIGDGRTFRNGRQLAAWLGLVPRQSSSGGRERLLGISKRGDVYLRTLRVHGARAVLRQRSRRPGQADSWLLRLGQRRHTNIAVVALANKNARIAWALLAHRRSYRPDYRAKDIVAAA